MNVKVVKLLGRISCLKLRQGAAASIHTDIFRVRWKSLDQRSRPAPHVEYSPTQMWKDLLNPQSHKQIAKSSFRKTQNLDPLGVLALSYTEEGHVKADRSSLGWPRVSSGGIPRFQPPTFHCTSGEQVVAIAKPVHLNEDQDRLSIRLLMHS